MNKLLISIPFLILLGAYYHVQTIQTNNSESSNFLKLNLNYEPTTVYEYQRCYYDVMENVACAIQCSPFDFECLNAQEQFHNCRRRNKNCDDYLLWITKANAYQNLPESFYKCNDECKPENKETQYAKFFYGCMQACSNAQY